MSIKKISLAFISLWVFALALPAQSGQEIINREIFILDQESPFSVSMNIPSRWRAETQPGINLPLMERTFNIRLDLPSGEKAVLIITIGQTALGGPISGRDPISLEQFNQLAESRVSALMPYAVEDRAIFHDVIIPNGYARYSTITDASLVDKVIPPNEYLYLTMYFANYENGSFVFASYLSDHMEDNNFALMLDLLASMEFFM